MFFSYSTEYIKYLNEQDCHGLNYDQWKDRKLRQEKKKHEGKRKNQFSTRYNY